MNPAQKNEPFWLLSNYNDPDSKVAILEDGSVVDKERLIMDIESVGQAFPEQRKLFLLKVSNNYDSLVDYLACLRFGQPFILIDENVEAQLLDSMISIYEPNYLLHKGGLNKLSERSHSLNDELAMLLSTSGTTGSPKLVRLSYNNIASNSFSICEYLGIRDSDTAIMTLPMSYSYGLSIINTHLQMGAVVVVNSDSIISREFWKRVQDYNVNTFAGVPFTFQMLRKLGYKRFNSSSIRYLTQAGGKLDVETLSYFMEECEALGQSFVVMYGQTEASPRISYLPPESLNDKLGSIGVAIPEGELFLTDTRGNLILEAGVEGEICYSGPNVMLGYATKPVDFSLGNTQSGRLETGDIGYFDKDCFFFITGRAKRFIKLFGLRLSLDAIDDWFATSSIQAVATGNDDKLIICIEDGCDYSENKVIEKVSTTFKINQNFVQTRMLKSIPRKNGGKVDFKQLSILLGKEGAC